MHIYTCMQKYALHAYPLTSEYAHGQQTGEIGKILAILVFWVRSNVLCKVLCVSEYKMVIRATLRTCHIAWIYSGVWETLSLFAALLGSSGCICISELLGVLHSSAQQGQSFNAHPPSSNRSFDLDEHPAFTLFVVVGVTVKSSTWAKCLGSAFDLGPRGGNGEARTCRRQQIGSYEYLRWRVVAE